MHTPDQARELWCPMVRIARHESVDVPVPIIPGSGHSGASHQALPTIVAGCNTDALGRNRVPASCRCIADQCAMWRWALHQDEPNWRTVGYCGLAGRPDMTS